MAGFSVNSSKQPALTSEMIRILECPVCLELPFPPVYQCIRGHNICKACRPALPNCSLCRSDFLDTRNFIVEQIISTSYLPCKYVDNGCAMLVLGSQAEEHSNKHCQFRPGVCPMMNFPGCSNKHLRTHELKRHLVEFHYAQVWPNETIRSYPINFEHEASQTLAWLDILEHDSRSFLVCLISKMATAYWAILLIGTDEDAKKYRAEIVVEPQTVHEIAWRFPVCSINFRTIFSVAFEETDAFIPCCRFEQLKRAGRINKAIPNQSVINVQYKIDSV